MSAATVLSNILPPTEQGDGPVVLVSGSSFLNFFLYNYIFFLLLTDYNYTFTYHRVVTISKLILWTTMELRVTQVTCLVAPLESEMSLSTFRQPLSPTVMMMFLTEGKAGQI